ncbi:hypothetical protein HGRIS_008651 [Hohenbuehelia grisea]
MYCVSVAHFGMAFSQYLKSLGGSPTGTNYARHFGRVSLAKVVVSGINCWLADLLLIWRGWVIYSRDKRVIIFPLITFVALLVASIGYYVKGFIDFNDVTGNELSALYLWAHATPLRTWGILVIVFSSATNLSMTGAISFKLIRHQRYMRKTIGYSRAWIESLVIIDSGAVYSLACLVYLGLYVANHEAEGIMLDIVSQLSGVVLTLVIVTIAAGLTPIELHPQPVTSYTASTAPPMDSRPTTRHLTDGMSSVSHDMTFAIVEAPVDHSKPKPKNHSMESLSV